MALVSQILDSARTYLDDENGLLWPDNRLMPKLQEAFRELLLELLLADIPIINEVSVILTIPALVTDDLNLDMSTVTNYPTNMINPISMRERLIGEQNRDFVEMTQVDFIPNVPKDRSLLYWSWEGGTIVLRGALNSVQVELRYQRTYPVPTIVTDNIPIVLAETYLSPKVASLSLVASRQFDHAGAMALIAKTNLDKIIGINVKQLQDLPARRMAYHRGKGKSVLRDF